MANATKPGTVSATVPPVAKRADRVVIKYGFDDEKSEHRWTFGAGIPDLVFNTNLPRPIDIKAKNHGYKQKIGDAGALSVDTANGKSATLAEKRAAMQEIVDRLETGEWNGKAGGRLIDVDALVAAIAATLKKNVVGVRAFVESKDEAGRKALAQSAQFAVGYALAVANARPKTEIAADVAAEMDKIPD